MHISCRPVKAVMQSMHITGMQCDSIQQHVHVDLASRHIALPASQWLQSKCFNSCPLFKHKKLA